MAALAFGKIEEFDLKEEEWPQYVERLGHYFVANGVDVNEKKRAIFLTLVGPKTYKLLRSLIHPATPNDKSYAELVEALTKHFKPTPSEIVQRFRFNTRSRKPGETVAQYVSELRALAEYCNFGDTLETMLRDRLVCGVNDEKIQNRLLSESGLTYQKALGLAQSLETAAQNLKELQQKQRGEGSGMETGNRQHSGILKIGGGQRRYHPGPEAAKKGACYRCGKEGHHANKCKFREATCHNCGKRGHLKAVCRSKFKKKSPRSKVGQMEDEYDEEYLSEGDRLHTIHAVSASRPLMVSVVIDGQRTQMELDTGAAYSIVSEKLHSELWPDAKLEECKLRLKSYAGENIPVLGSREVLVHYQDQSERLQLIVVRGTGASLFGRNWLKCLRLDWHSINSVARGELQTLLDKYKGVFESGLGTLKGFKAKITVEPDATPKFCKARPVPYSLRDQVEAELQRLVKEGILEPVEHADWASPIVAILKADKKSVRICGDFKQTVNPVSRLDRYPIPKIEDLFAKLAGGQQFTKLDLSQAYQQLPLDDESKQFVVINTHKGLFRYVRLPFGIASAPAIFQRVMDNLLNGIPGVVNYIDDILVTGESTEEHLHSLEEVLRRLEKAGLFARRDKCEFMAPSVTYLGHQIDASGLHPVAEKVRAIDEAPAPRNVQELRSYLGLLTYYSKFLQNMSTVLAPLYRLLRNDVKWSWGKQEAKAFKASKKLLTSSALLVHFDPTLKLVLACDASSYGVGAVLAHQMPDGSERPIGYASRTLSAAERNYSQIEREGLACVFGVKRFHAYLFGHHFQLVTDHKPLLALLNQHRSTSVQASARIRRWSLILSMYDYTISFRKTQDHGNADALSRLPLPEQPDTVPIPAELVLLVDQLNDSPVTAWQVQRWTGRDPILSTVVNYVRHGWPVECEEEFKPYFNRKEELSVHLGCLLWGARVVIPPKAREAMLLELHNGHPGTTRMKSLARMHMWWPGMDKEIEKAVNSCEECQMQQSLPPVAPLQPWKWPTRPWTRLHIDFAGPMTGGKMILVVIDAHSKWIEAIPTNGATSAIVIEQLRTLFSQFGIPEVIVSDNGPCFASAEYASFLSSNGVKRILVAPYHPASNGLAERAVQIVKRGLKKVIDGSWQSRIARVLFAYRITPQSTTGVSPSELLFGRQLRSRLDFIKPNAAARVEMKQQKQKESHDVHSRKRSFEAGNLVYAQNFSSGPRWLLGEVVKTTGPVSILVKLADGRMIRRHQDQVRIRKADLEPPRVSGATSTELLPTLLEGHGVEEETSNPPPSVPSETIVEPTVETLSNEPESVPVKKDNEKSHPVSPTTSPPARKFYPQRERKKPDWLDGPRNP